MNRMRQQTPLLNLNSFVWIGTISIPYIIAVCFSIVATQPDALDDRQSGKLNRTLSQQEFLQKKCLVFEKHSKTEFVNPNDCIYSHQAALTQN